MNQLLVEKMQVVPLILPVNLQTGANNGDWVSMKGYRRCSIVLIKGAGTAGDDPTLTFLQATTVAAAGSKALNVTRIDKKQAATDLTAVGQFTTSTSAVPATNDTFSTNTWTNSDLAEQTAVVVAEFKAEDLDIANNFDCLTCNIADIGTHSQIGAVIAILHDPVYSVDPLQSAIVD